jgi:hypothetical protein
MCCKSRVTGSERALADGFYSFVCGTADDGDSLELRGFDARATADVEPAECGVGDRRIDRAHVRTRTERSLSKRMTIEQYDNAAEGLLRMQDPARDPHRILSQLRSINPRAGG